MRVIIGAFFQGNRQPIIAHGSYASQTMVLFPKFLEWRISGDNELYPRGSSNNQLPDELNVVQLTCRLSIRMCRSIVSCTNEMKVLQQYLPVMQYVFRFVCLFVCLFICLQNRICEFS